MSGKEEKSDGGSYLVMTRTEIEEHVLTVFRRNFEIENPQLDDNLRETHNFDSIDAIELLLEIEKMLGSELTLEEKKQAMDIRTIRQICEYIESLASVRKAVPEN
jgi:acyl carrier protein